MPGHSFKLVARMHICAGVGGMWLGHDIGEGQFVVVDLQGV